MTMDSPKFGDPVLIPAHDKNSLELIDVYCCTIDPKSCSKLVGKLGTIAPLRAIKHAKRIRKRKDQTDKLDVLLLPVHQEDSLEDEEETENGSNPSTTPFLPPKTTTEAPSPSPSFHQTPSTLPSGELPLSVLPHPSLASLLEEYTQSVFVVQIPRYPPHTKEDQVSWGKYWPVGIHVATKLTLRDKVTLSPEEITEMKRNMAIVMGMIDTPVKNGGRLGLNACIIVDPTSADGDGGGENGGVKCTTILGSGVDETSVHPLRHASMIAIETVADWQKKTWFSNDPKIEIDENIFDGAGAEGDGDGDNKEEEAKRRRLDLVEDDPSTRPVIDESTPYLCTGYDCYVVHEPCIMCAMALVHSRLRRVIFCRKDDKGGALGGCGLKLHSKRTLNHHYVVYHLPLLD